MKTFVHAVLSTLTFSLLFLSFLYPAVLYRIPLLLPFSRPWDGICSVVLAVVSAVILSRVLQRKRLVYVVALLAFCSSGSFLYREMLFRYKKRVVLQTEPSRLHRYGQHIMIGFYEESMVQELVERDAIGGIFVTRHNLDENKTGNRLKEWLATLQAIRLQRQHPALYVATDQEGGIVEKLSPPLNEQPPLSSLKKDGVFSQEDIRSYSQVQARGIKEIGINLNFSPVVDVDYKVYNPQDQYSQISKRSISGNRKEIVNVATLYAQAHVEEGVTPTLKHFPGLGSVFEDTHLSAAMISSSCYEKDSKIFFDIAQQAQTAIMLSHVKIQSVEEEVPASASRFVIHDIIRTKNRFSGLLVTDDYAMLPISLSAQGIGFHAKTAIDAGLNLILVTGDADQYYELMYSLLQEEVGVRYRRPLHLSIVQKWMSWDQKRSKAEDKRVCNKTDEP